MKAQPPLLEALTERFGFMRDELRAFPAVGVGATHGTGCIILKQASGGRHRQFRLGVFRERWFNAAHDSR